MLAASGVLGRAVIEGLLATVRAWSHEQALKAFLLEMTIGRERRSYASTAHEDEADGVAE
jgi:hypothetical protein